MSARLRPDHRAFVVSAAATVLSRTGILAIAWLAAWFLEQEIDGPLRTSFAELWLHWDARHLLTIAEHGYTHELSDEHAAAFFPLFPLLVRALSVVGLTSLSAAFLINTLATVAALYFLHKLVADESDQDAADRAVIYLAIFPTAVFLVAPYTEALFLAGATAAFFFARKGNALAAGAAAAVAVGARAAGLFLVAGLVTEILVRRGWTRTALLRAGLVTGLSLMPLAAFMFFQEQAFGSPFAFLEAQKEGWGRAFVGPIDSFTATWRTQFGDYPANWVLAWRIEILAAAVGVGMVVWAALQRRWGYAVFMATMLAALITSSWYYSIPRMMLSMFPIPVLVAEATRRRPAVQAAITATFASLAVLGAVAYTQGAWFF